MERPLILSLTVLSLLLLLLLYILTVPRQINMCECQLGFALSRIHDRIVSAFHDSLRSLKTIETLETTILFTR